MEVAAAEVTEVGAREVGGWEVVVEVVKEEADWAAAAKEEED